MTEAASASPSSAPPRRPGAGESLGLFRTGWIAIILVVGGLALWSVLAPWEGAVLASGTIEVEGEQQAVQHLTGGIVAELRVAEGDRVSEGQTLIVLDSTEGDAALGSVDARLTELLAREARLLAEQQGSEALALRGGLPADLAAAPALAANLAAQSDLAAARRDTLDSRRAQLEQRVGQLDARISGNTEESATVERQLALLADEIRRYERLLQTGDAAEVLVLSRRRDAEALQGRAARLRADTASARAEIGESRAELSRLDREFSENVQTELGGVRTEIAELLEQRRAAAGQLGRLEVRAPRSGQVIGLSANTVGGVAAPGEPLMFIVPDGDALFASVQIMPADIDKIEEGQPARLRFSAFNVNTTPEFESRVTGVSADALVDEGTRLPYYEARLAIPAAEAAALGLPLRPGMPVDAMVRTDRRSVVSYLLRPLTDAMNRTFRD